MLPLQGDTDLFVQLVETHAGMVYDLAWRVTGNPEDAEDVVQDVFFRIAKRQAVSLPPPEWPRFLRRAATNAAIDVLRRKKRRPELTLETGDLDALTAPGSTPLDDLLQQELAIRLRSEIAKLAPREAAVIVLRHFEGMSYQDIADTLGITRNAVGVTLHSARRRLQESLRDLIGEGSVPARKDAHVAGRRSRNRKDT